MDETACGVNVYMLSYFYEVLLLFYINRRINNVTAYCYR